uniref:Uncharacterized protein n=1 Tax=Panthera tigris altaica TaxID=74533 RepID=A0A8C9JBR7_PANTA
MEPTILLRDDWTPYRIKKWHYCCCFPHRGFVIAALKENALSFLLGTACCFLSIAPAHTRCPSPSKALLFPSVGSVLWSIFAEEKVTGKQERMGKVKGQSPESGMSSRISRKKPIRLKRSK